MLDWAHKLTLRAVAEGDAVAPVLALVILFAVVNSARGDALLTETQIFSLLAASVVMGLVVAYAKRSAR